MIGRRRSGGQVVHGVVHGVGDTFLDPFHQIFALAAMVRVKIGRAHV